MMKLLRAGVLAKRKKISGTYGSLYLPEDRPETQFAKVTHVSEGEQRIKVGDIVLYKKHAGMECPEFGDGITFFSIDEIEGIVTKEPVE